MKIIVVGESEGIDNKLGCPAFYIKPDSALVKGGKPFFVPDGTSRCEARYHWVARVSRLGKSIARRWADRYYDALTLGVTFTAQDIATRLQDHREPWALATAADNSAAIGEMVEADRLRLMTSPAVCTLNGKAVATASLEGLRDRVADVIARLSLLMTLRQGDLIYLGPLTEGLPVKPDDHLAATIGDTRLLAFNVK